MAVHVRGHPIHTILVAFPIGLLTFAMVFDVIFSVTGGAGWYTAAYYNLLFGLITAVPTAIFGFFDFTQITDERAADVAVQHMVVNVGALLLYLVSFLVRATAGAGSTAPMYGIGWRFALGLSVGGALLLMVGGWLGGHLVYRHRVGVGIEPANHLVPKPDHDEAGNAATDFPDFPATEPGLA